MGVALAKDATWKDCELAARDPDRSIAACEGASLGFEVC
jgi:hypothetical protein